MDEKQFVHLVASERSLAKEACADYRREFARLGSGTGRFSAALRLLARPSLEAEVWLDHVSYLLQQLSLHPEEEARKLTVQRCWRSAFSRGGSAGMDDVIAKAEIAAAGRMLEFLGVHGG